MIDIERAKQEVDSSDIVTLRTLARGWLLGAVDEWCKMADESSAAADELIQAQSTFIAAFEAALVAEHERELNTARLTARQGGRFDALAGVLDTWRRLKAEHGLHNDDE